MIKLGTRVRIKDWETLAQENGVIGDSIIPTPPVFNSDMRPFCGKYGVVVGFSPAHRIKLKIEGREITQYVFAEWMFSEIYDDVIRVGDWVQIRDWDAMRKQYGFDLSGRIDMPHLTFVENMRPLCGMIAQVVGKSMVFNSAPTAVEVLDLGENPVLAQKQANYKITDRMVKKVKGIE